jgi:hypothetical protein
MNQTLVTRGDRRRCGTREPGGAYMALPLGPGGSPVEAFLVDPPIVVDAGALGLSAVGVTMIDRGGVTHVLDVVGRRALPDDRRVRRGGAQAGDLAADLQDRRVRATDVRVAAAGPP